jgi:hypothetical protein
VVVHVGAYFSVVPASIVGLYQGLYPVIAYATQYIIILKYVNLNYKSAKHLCTCVKMRVENLNLNLDLDFEKKFPTFPHSHILILFQVCITENVDVG